jgi:enoyl-[acyl-carrier protein] reductase I
MHRFYVSEIALDTPFFTLNEEESKHACRVLRLKIGDAIELVDGRGNLFSCTITEDHPKRCTISVNDVYSEPNLPYSLHVALAPTKNMDRMEWFVEKATEILGGKLDFVLHSIGMSVNVRKGNHYTSQNYDFTHKGWDVSAVSFHKVMQVLYQKDAMNEWGSVVALTYMAAQRVFPDYNDMADNKAYLESIARSFGYFFGKDKKVRVNTISQAPTPTTAGQGVKGFDGFITYADKMSPLGNATALDCANYTVAMFSDLTRRVTLQNLYNDGGFSNMGVSQAVMETFVGE